MFESAYSKIRGIVYFPRMIQKIQLNETGHLPEDYLPYLGKGFDARCCQFLKVKYEDVVDHVKLGETPEQILEWCFNNGRNPNEEEILVWNEFMIKRGWRDSDQSPTAFSRYKEKYGYPDRPDILTYFDFFEVDEGRKS